MPEELSTALPALTSPPLTFTALVLDERSTDPLIVESPPTLIVLSPSCTASTTPKLSTADAVPDVVLASAVELRADSALMIPSALKLCTRAVSVGPDEVSSSDAISLASLMASEYPMAALASAFVLMPTLALMFVSSPASILVSREPRAVVKVLLAFAPPTVSVSVVEFVTSALALSVVFAALLRSSSPCASIAVTSMPMLSARFVDELESPPVVSLSD